MTTKSLIGRTTLASVLVLSLGAGLLASTPVQADGIGFSFSMGGGDMMRDDGMPMHDRGFGLEVGGGFDVNTDVINRVLLEDSPRVTGTAYGENPATGHSIDVVYYSDGFKIVKVDGGAAVKVKMKPAKVAKPKPKKIKVLKKQRLADGGTLTFYNNPNTGQTFAVMEDENGRHVNVNGTIGFQGQDVPFR